MDGWLLLGDDSHVPHQLDLDGLIDLDDLIVALSKGIALVLYPTAADFVAESTRCKDGLMDGWMDGWLRLGEDSHVPHQLDLVGLVDLAS
jgi:hypothetical protein